MSTILLLGGTTEGRLLAEALAHRDVSVLACTATEYGAELLPHAPNLSILEGRRNQAELADLMRQEQVTLALDATHPYARIATENLRAACAECGVEYRRVLRDASQAPDAIWVADTAAAITFLADHPGRFLLTTGAKELAAYASLPDFAERAYVRVLPMEQSIQLCHAAGLSGAHILAMQGPFSTELNLALLRQFEIAWMVTKDGGIPGGMLEKMAAAQQAGVPLLIIGRPPEAADALSLSEALELLNQRFPAAEAPAQKQIFLISAGMGSCGSLTLDAWEALKHCQVLFGAPRLVQADWLPALPRFPVYLPDKIQACLREHPDWTRVGILLSGDVGFWSGAEKLKAVFPGEEVFLLPGVSTVQYLAAKIGICWQDAALVSLHGRPGDPAEAVRTNRKVLFLTGGDSSPAQVCQALCAAGFSSARVWIGERLSYPDERILAGTAEQFQSFSGNPLAALFVLRESEASV